jgi:hypothetical protein
MCNFFISLSNIVCLEMLQNQLQDLVSGTCFCRVYQKKSTNRALAMVQTTHRKVFEDKDLVASLETGVKFWDDYSRVQYHPQSLCELHGSWRDFDKFDACGAGREVVSEWSQIEGMDERLRFFVEDCDHVQVSFFPATNY